MRGTGALAHSGGSLSTMESVQETLAAVDQVHARATAGAPRWVLGALSVLFGVTIAFIIWEVTWAALAGLGALIVIIVVRWRDFRRGVRPKIRQDPGSPLFPPSTWWSLAPLPFTWLAIMVPAHPWWIGACVGVITCAASYWYLVAMDERQWL